MTKTTGLPAVFGILATVILAALTVPAIAQSNPKDDPNNHAIMGNQGALNTGDRNSSATMREQNNNGISGHDHDAGKDRAKNRMGDDHS